LYYISTLVLFNPHLRQAQKRCFAIALLRVGLMAKQRSAPLRGQLTQQSAL
jgi:hypothetical protein